MQKGYYHPQMDKASIIKDAIEYILQLQQLERQLLAEISILESASARPLLIGTLSSSIAAAVVDDSCCDGNAVVSPTKKMKMDMLSPGSTASHGSSAAAAPSLPVDALEVITIANCNHFICFIKKK
jgi:hypothetical protein